MSLRPSCPLRTPSVDVQMSQSSLDSSSRCEATQPHQTPPHNIPTSTSRTYKRYQQGMRLGAQTRQNVCSILRKVQLQAWKLKLAFAFTKAALGHDLKVKCHALKIMVGIVQEGDGRDLKVDGNIGNAFNTMLGIKAKLQLPALGTGSCLALYDTRASCLWVLKSERASGIKDEFEHVETGRALYKKQQSDARIIRAGERVASQTFPRGASYQKVFLLEASSIARSSFATSFISGIVELKSKFSQASIIIRYKFVANERMLRFTECEWDSIEGKQLAPLHHPRAAA
eukprot:3940084-Pleurochrysis_carterae.AAC.1